MDNQKILQIFVVLLACAVVTGCTHTDSGVSASNADESQVVIAGNISLSTESQASTNASVSSTRSALRYQSVASNELVFVYNASSGEILGVTATDGDGHYSLDIEDPFVDGEEVDLLVRSESGVSAYVRSSAGTTEAQIEVNADIDSTLVVAGLETLVEENLGRDDYSLEEGMNAADLDFAPSCYVAFEKAIWQNTDLDGSQSLSGVLAILRDIFTTSALDEDVRGNFTDIRQMFQDLVSSDPTSPDILSDVFTITAETTGNPDTLYRNAYASTATNYRGIRDVVAHNILNLSEDGQSGLSEAAIGDDLCDDDSSVMDAFVQSVVGMSFTDFIDSFGAASRAKTNLLYDLVKHYKGTDGRIESASRFNAQAAAGVLSAATSEDLQNGRRADFFKDILDARPDDLSGQEAQTWGKGVIKISREEPDEDPVVIADFMSARVGVGNVSLASDDDDQALRQQFQQARSEGQSFSSCRTALSSGGCEADITILRNRLEQTQTADATDEVEVDEEEVNEEADPEAEDEGEEQEVEVDGEEDSPEAEDEGDVEQVEGQDDEGEGEVVEVEEEPDPLVIADFLGAYVISSTRPGCGAGMTTAGAAMTGYASLIAPHDIKIAPILSALGVHIDIDENEKSCAATKNNSACVSCSLTGEGAAGTLIDITCPALQGACIMQFEKQ